MIFLNGSGMNAEWNSLLKGTGTRRWKIAPQTMDIYVVEIEKQDDRLIYSRQFVDKCIRSDKEYLYSISDEELLKNPLLNRILVGKN